MSDDFESGDKLTHPAIREAVQTSWVCPDQWEGWLITGQAFYFRYRHGIVSLAVGADLAGVAGITRPSQAGPDVRVAILGHGDGLSGHFDTDEERADMFGQLISELASRQ